MEPVLLSSAYLPPVSFFSAMNNGADVLIEQYDSYCKQTYRNRCRIATSSGIQTLTIPVVKPSGSRQLMKDVRISDHGEWRHQHWNALESAYMNSPYFMYYEDDFRPFYEKKYEFLFDLNMELTQLILNLAGMDKNILPTREYVKQPDGINDLREFADPNIPIEGKRKAYWQVFRERHGFLENLSAADLLFNMGPEFPLYL